MTDAKLEYQWLKNATSDDTIDSPFWPMLGELTRLLSEELALSEEAHRQNEEIRVQKLPIEGSSWVRIELAHPTNEVPEILAQLQSQAAEGIACALIISLSNSLRSLSKLFNADKSLLGFPNSLR